MNLTNLGQEGIGVLSYSQLAHDHIASCQRGGVSDEPPWLWAATRHGPGTLYSEYHETPQ